MSQLLITRFFNELDRLRKISGTSRESVVREAFKDLLKAWGKQHELVFIPEYEYETPAKTRVYPDGALLYSLRVPLGHWEAKDEDDDLDREIHKKETQGLSAGGLRSCLAAARIIPRDCSPCGWRPLIRFACGEPPSPARGEGSPPLPSRERGARSAG